TAGSQDRHRNRRAVQPLIRAVTPGRFRASNSRAEGAPLFEELELRPARLPEMLRREFYPPAIETRLSARELEHVPRLLGVDSLAPHTAVKIRAVQLPAAHGADAVQHLVLPVGEMPPEPRLEYIGDTVRQPQHDEPRVHGPRVGRALYDRRYLVVRKARD